MQWITFVFVLAIFVLQAFDRNAIERRIDTIAEVCATQTKPTHVPSKRTYEFVSLGRINDE